MANRQTSRGGACKRSNAPRGLDRFALNNALVRARADLERALRDLTPLQGSKYVVIRGQIDKAIAGRVVADMRLLRRAETAVASAQKLAGARAPAPAPVFARGVHRREGYTPVKLSEPKAAPARRGAAESSQLSLFNPKRRLVAPVVVLRSGLWAAIRNAADALSRAGIMSGGDVSGRNGTFTVEVSKKDEAAARRVLSESKQNPEINLARIQRQKDARDWELIGRYASVAELDKARNRLAQAAMDSGARPFPKFKVDDEYSGPFGTPPTFLLLRKRTVTNPRKRSRRNPDDAAAVSASEGFHGRAASEVTVIETPVRVHGQLAELGDLISLEVRALNGNVVELSNFEGALLAMSPQRNQLYIEGGDQVVNLEDFGIDPDSAHDSEILGHCRRVRYYTTKDHLGDEGGEATYKHRFGEAGGLEPHLVYDCVNGLLSFAGGSYTIPDEGITD